MQTGELTHGNSDLRVRVLRDEGVDIILGLPFDVPIRERCFGKAPIHSQYILHNIVARNGNVLAYYISCSSGSFRGVDHWRKAQTRGSKTRSMRRHERRTALS